MTFSKADEDKYIREHMPLVKEVDEQYKNEKLVLPNIKDRLELARRVEQGEDYSTVLDELTDAER